jgi:hypothetical protein
MLLLISLFHKYQYVISFAIVGGKCNNFTFRIRTNITGVNFRLDFSIFLRLFELFVISVCDSL